MWKFKLTLIAGLILSSGVLAQEANAQIKIQGGSLRAEKPWPFTRRSPEDDAPRDRVLPGSQKPTELYLQVKKFYEQGGQQWLEIGVENTVPNAIKHLVEEHHYTREQLIGYDVITLNWIHGMAHEWGNPEPPEKPLRAEKSL